MKTLQEVFTPLDTRRRYEVWFVRMGLADGSGAWWFRYLLFNPGRGGCSESPRGMPVQVWATWFPRDGKPKSFVQGFPLADLALSARRKNPFHFSCGPNEMGENFCRGALEVDGHRITWELNYRSTFHGMLSNKGWIGFSATPHSDAVFSGRVELDGRSFATEPLGFGVQGHNCGYRHRAFWLWAHAYFERPGNAPSSFEALVYEMPFGLVFRKAVLWHKGKMWIFPGMTEHKRDREDFLWEFTAFSRDGTKVEVKFDGNGPARHCLAYVKTDCSGTFDVFNNSLSGAVVRLTHANGNIEEFRTVTGAVLEMTGI